MKRKGRLLVVLVFFLLFGLLVIIRLFYWQVIKSEELTLLAANQREKIHLIEPLRGKILTQDNFPLVTNQKTYLLFADPSKIKIQEKEKIAQELSFYFLTEKEATLSAQEKEKILKEKKEKIEEILSPRDKFWVPLRHNLTLEEKEKIEKLAYEGLGFEEEMVRFYPEASMAAHLLGFVGSDFTGQPTGYFGLEGYYDLELKGKEGKILQEKDVHNLPILTGLFNKEEGKNGKDLVLHLDRSLQWIVEEELKKGLEKYQAKSGYVVVMDPFSGAILAMAALPAYEPANFLDYPQDFYKNPIIAELYEPGSTFKVLVMAAALNEGVVQPQTHCEICDGPFKIDKYLIKTWNEKYYPQQTMIEVIQHSDNVGMVFVGQKLGKEKFINYLNLFGIGQKTGIDLQEEANIPLKEKSEWNEVDLATASFGQGLVVTGIQMIRAVSAIANGGKILEPHVVEKIVSEEKNLTIKPKLIRTVISKKTSEEVTAMMVNAVEQGEVKWAKPKGYQIAGKTGTAQIPVAGHYDKEKTIASFVGFAPPEEPKFIMLVYLREPQSSPWGSETAAPLFFQIAKRIFLYWNIAPKD